MPTDLHSNLVSCFLEFLEVAVHTVLYTRNLYHKEAFERCRAFNTFTRRSRHPELNSYISSTISRLRVSACGPISYHIPFP
jgi:mitotic spindle assembly checkpoint protein MAD2B